jgi:hypothetical protein
VGIKEKWNIFSQSQILEGCPSRENHVHHHQDFMLWSIDENIWLVFQIYADTITQQCADATVPDWIDRLGGADLFTYDHCWKVSESQRID